MNIVAHNLSAMNAQRWFGINTGSKTKSAEKLSSGYKISRAADDAAGLAISEKMRRQIRGLTQGVENTQDGVSLCQVADGALAEVNDMLHRITELSVKSANGTNSEQDRQYIQEEIGQILQEIERISEATTFNEQKIFDGKIKGMGSVGDKEQTVTRTEFLQLPITVTGASEDGQEASYIVAADKDTGITIGSTQYGWSLFETAAGEQLDINDIKAGTYSIEHKGMSFSFQVADDYTGEMLAESLDGITWSTIEEVQPGGVAFTFSVKSGVLDGKSQTIPIQADESGITINYLKKDWSSFTDGSGNPLNPDAIVPGNYTLDLYGITYSLDIQKCDNISQIAQGITPKTVITTEKELKEMAVSSISNCTYKYESGTVDILDQFQNKYIYADEEGIWTTDSAKVTWETMGIDKVNPQAGTYRYSDDASGMHFDFEIGNNATLEGIVNGLNKVSLDFDVEYFFSGGTSICHTYDVDKEKMWDDFHLVPYSSTDTTKPSLEINNRKGVLEVFSGDEIPSELSFYMTAAAAGSSLSLECSRTVDGQTKYSRFDLTDMSYYYLKDYFSKRQQYYVDIDFNEEYGPLEFEDSYGNIIRLTVEDNRADVYDSDSSDFYTISEMFSAWEDTEIVFRDTDAEYTCRTMGAQVNSMSSGNYGIVEYQNSVDQMLYDVKENTYTYIPEVDLSSVPSVEVTITETIKVPTQNNAESGSWWIQSGCEAGHGMWLVIDEMNTSVLGIEDVDVSTVNGAKHAMDAVKGALTKVMENRSKIGAQQNRLEHTIANEENVIENTTAAESGIRDTDMAKEMVRYSNSSILEQVGHAMMAQANQSNRGVLSLLN